MPWHKVKNHSACPASKPIAVVKDEGGKVVGCHATEKGANKQLAALHAAEGRSMELMERMRERLVNAISMAFDDLEPENDGKVDDHRLFTRTVIQRDDKNDTYRWFSVSAVAARNRVGEVDSRALFDSFVAIANVTGRYPERDFMHLGRWGKEFRLGQCDFMARDGNVFVTSGLYYDTELARMEIAAREKNPDDWGDSVEFLLLDDPAWDGGTPVFEMGFLRFIATVPEKMAASHFTSGVVMDMEVDRMAMDKQQLDAFVKLFGDKDKARKWLEKYVDDVEDAIQEAGMMTRSLSDEPAGDDPSETVAPTEVTIDFEGAVEEEMQVIVARSLEPVLQQVKAMGDQIAELIKGLQSLTDVSNENATALTERIVALERDEEEKQHEWLEDIPAKSLVRVTHRPSEVARSNGGRESLAERAESAMDSWNVSKYTENE